MGWVGYPTPSDPGITLPAIWEVGRSTLAVFEGFSSSAKNNKNRRTAQPNAHLIGLGTEYPYHHSISMFAG